MPASDATPALVLDTNAVLDWLLFRDQAMTACAAAIETGTVRWVTCRRAVDELEATLRKPALSHWNPNSEQVLTVVDRFARVAANPTASLAPALRCSDPDDQVFLELALAHRARWLLSHDRALLKLARRSRSLGLRIVPPAAWSLSDAAAPAAGPGSPPTAPPPAG